MAFSIIDTYCKWLSISNYREREAKQALLLVQISIGIFSSATLFEIFKLIAEVKFLPENWDYVFITILQISIGVSHILLRSGKLKYARHLFLLPFWITYTYIILRWEGYQNPLYQPLFVIVIVAYLIFDQKEALIYLGLMIMTMIVLFLVEYSDMFWKPQDLQINTTTHLALDLSLAIIVITSLLSLVTDHSRSLESLYQHEKLLVESEKNYRSLFNDAPLAIVSFDYNGNFLSFNERFLKLLKFEEDELQNKNINGIIKISSLDKTILDYQGIEVGESITREVTFSTKNLSHVLFDANIKMLDLDRFIAIMKDITEQRKIERRLTKMENQLKESQKMEAVGRLAGGISHDNNNMLTGLIGYIELLEMKIEDEELEEYIHEIKTLVNRSAALTQQLLAFSNKKIISPTTININEPLSKFKGFLRNLVDPNINFQVKLDESVQPIIIDPVQFDQILVNLCINANEAIIGDGNLIVESLSIPPTSQLIEKYHLDKNQKGYTLIKISDDGPGIPKDVQQYLFEPFFTTKEEGTGLGLSIVYSSVEQNKGKIYVESEIGKGTQFYIFFPAAEKIKVEPSKETGDQSVQQTEPRSLRIMLFEDEAAIRNILETSLKAKNHEVISFADGNDIDLIVRSLNDQPDLLITDLMLPGMSGVGVAKLVRSRFHDIPIIFITGYFGNPQLLTNEFIMDDTTKLLEKPFSTDELNEVIENMKIGLYN